MSNEEIKNLVKKYEDIKNLGKLRSYTEEQTKKDFILPLFKTLGWDVYGSKEVSAEETISSGRVDYGFYFNDRAKFYLEAKKFNVDIRNEKFANQAIKYSFNKGVTWAVLTNFETLILFNAQNIEGNLYDKRFFEVKCDEFLERIDQLKLLSKEAFKDNLLDKEAEKIGKKIQRVSVSNILYKDLQICRDILTKDLGQWNDKVNPDLLDEGVQKLLDRFIFIRVAEDRGIEPPTLIPLVRQAREDTKKRLYQAMAEKFREFDHLYNSNLFLPHPFEQWEEYSEATEKAINILYGKKGYYEYDFKVMPADVLGAVYESYLSHRLSKSKKGTTVSKDASKRKEQGIYYTPDYIVDYIVKNALGPVLDKCKSVEEIKKIKVLDPACGSGSFLIKAFQVIFEKYKKLGFEGPEDLLKIRILQENIFGVDLDQQAVEITRLNLLINALTKRKKFPLLNNIKNGNSLISGTDKELREYFGKNFSDKKPFNWQEEFPEAFKQGGFDAIIGNPPYVMVENLPSDERSYLMEKYETAIKRFDIYVAFIEKGMSLLNKGGFLSFIIPYPFLNQNYAEKLRKKILSEFSLTKIVDLSDIKVFREAIIRNCILVIKRPSQDEKPQTKIEVKKVQNQEQAYLLDSLPSHTFESSFFLSLPKAMYRVDLDEDKNSLIEKVDHKSIKVGDVCYVNWGARTGNIKKYVVKEPIGDFCKKMVNARNIDRYVINHTDDYIVYKKDELYNPMFEELFESPKIIVRDISGKSRLRATLDYDKYYAEHTVSLAVPYHFLEEVERRGLSIADDQSNLSKKYDLRFIIALVNSKLVNYYFSSKLGGGLHVYPNDVKQLPIYKIDFSDKKEKKAYDEIVELAKKILELNKEIKKATEHSNKWDSLKHEIEKVDVKIDREVYRLYELTKDEMEVIEEFSEEQAGFVGLPRFCKKCVELEEDNYYGLFDVGVAWEGGPIKYPSRRCSKCGREIKPGEKVFIPKREIGR